MFDLRATLQSQKRSPTTHSKTREWFQFEGLHILLERDSHRRSLKVAVELNGTIRLVVPKTFRVPQAHEHLRIWKPWLVRGLEKAEELRRRFPIPSYKRGEPVLFGGEIYQLHYVKGENEQRVWTTGSLMVVEVPQEYWNESYLWAPQTQCGQWLRDFYKSRATEHFPERVKHWSARLNLSPKSIRIRGQMSLWGSCTAEGNLSLNWKLIAAPRGVIDYVIIHELCHLRHMDHSKEFWKLVESQCAEHKKHRAWLREHHHAFDFLNKHSTLYVSKL